MDVSNPWSCTQLAGIMVLPDMATYVMCVCQRVDAESSGCPEGGAVRGPLRNMCGTCRPEIVGSDTSATACSSCLAHSCSFVRVRSHCVSSCTSFR